MLASELEVFYYRAQEAALWSVGPCTAFKANVAPIMRWVVATGTFLHSASVCVFDPALTKHVSAGMEDGASR